VTKGRSIFRRGSSGSETLPARVKVTKKSTGFRWGGLGRLQHPPNGAGGNKGKKSACKGLKIPRLAEARRSPAQSVKQGCLLPTSPATREKAILGKGVQQRKNNPAPHTHLRKKSVGKKAPACPGTYSAKKKQEAPPSGREIFKYRQKATKLNFSRRIASVGGQLFQGPIDQPKQQRIKREAYHFSRWPNRVAPSG